MASSMESRVTALEVKTEFVETALEQNTREHAEIQECLHKIETHIASQNGTLPYLKENMDRLLARLDQQSEKVSSTGNALGKISVKVGLLWSLLGAALACLLTKLIS